MPQLWPDLHLQQWLHTGHGQRKRILSLFWGMLVLFSPKICKKWLLKLTRFRRMDVSWTQKKKTNFLVFVNLSMTFPVILTRGKAEGFSVTGNVCSQPWLCTTGALTVCFQLNFHSQLYSRTGPAPSQVTQRAGNGSRTALGLTECRDDFWEPRVGVVTGEIIPLSWSGWDRPWQWIPGVHPWEGMDDLVGSCPAFRDSTTDWVSLLFGGCARKSSFKPEGQQCSWPAAAPGIWVQRAGLHKIPDFLVMLQPKNRFSLNLTSLCVLNQE